MQSTQVIIYTSYLHTMGGIETFVLNFVDMLSEYYDIVVMSPKVPPEMIVRLARKVRVTEPIPMKCETLLMIRMMDKRPEDVKYDKLVRMCHAFNAFPNWHIEKDYDELVHVSDASKKSFNTHGEVIHNLLKPNTKKSLLLVSATRVPALDKGNNAERMLTLARMLSRSGIPFLWFNFSDGNIPNAPKGFINVGTYEDVQPYIAKADYLVQLSDHEGFCYSIVEALTNNTAVICTPFETTMELGVRDGMNGYIVPYDMNFDVNKLLNVPKFNYSYDNDELIRKWKKILGKKKPKHEYEPQDLHLIKANQPYRDIKLKKDVLKGEVTVATKERAKQIIDAGLADELR